MTMLTAGQDRDRSAVDDKYKWNLADVYPELAAWRAAKDAVTAELPRLRTYQGRLGSSAHVLADALEEASRQDKEIGRLAVYAGMFADQDTREAGPQGMQQEMQQLGADFKAQASYIEPELLRVGLETLERFIAAEPRLVTFTFYLHDIARRARHTLSDVEEKILADAMPLASSGHNIYNILANADFPYPTITLSDGRTARVDASGDAELRTLPDRGDREKAMSTFFTSLGAEYCGVVQSSFNERWIDFFPTAGKRSGAYSEGGAYDVHPYMLLNYLGQYNDVSTLAHELGHTMHSYHSNTVQPYALANYPTFVAEVASTFNEALLIDRVLRNTMDPATRLSLLGSFLENVKATVFRQTQFAEFELKMHQLAERGEPITGEALAHIYLDITRRYYGHTDDTCIVDEYVRHEWSYIPHFYVGFYVFQYATSFTAAEALSEKVRAGDDDARRRYLTFLGAGTSKYPIELLKDAGVDMTTHEPLDLTSMKMNLVMDEIVILLGSCGAEHPTLLPVQPYNRTLQ